MVYSMDSHKIPQDFLVFDRSGTVQDILVVENVWGKVLGMTFDIRDVLLGRSYQLPFQLLNN